MKGISLFSNIGIAELCLDKSHFNIILANDINVTRTKLYQKIHKNTLVLDSDIKLKKTQRQIIGIKENLDFIISTPPCQGMSTAGKKEKYDPRNHLIKYSIDIIKIILPKYVFHENVPGQEKTLISFKGRTIKIPEYIELELSEFYNIEKSICLMSEFGVPQERKRSIYLLTRKDIEKKWIFPEKKKPVKTLEIVIKHLPSVDPYISDVKRDQITNIFPNFFVKLENALRFSEYHEPVSHPLRQIVVMENTPTGKSAFENDDKYKPRKKDGTLVKGFRNTYKRLSWNKPSSTITTYNRTISSQENVHPGREFLRKGKKCYSDARVFTLLEIFIIMSIPINFRFPKGYSNSFLRTVIGEGIPPLFVKKIFEKIKQ